MRTSKILDSINQLLRESDYNDLDEEDEFDGSVVTRVCDNGDILYYYCDEYRLSINNNIVDIDVFVKYLIDNNVLSKEDIIFILSNILKNDEYEDAEDIVLRVVFDY